MKYNIFDYNQKKAVEIGLDLKDLLILNWIQTFYPKMHKTIRDGKQYFWVKYSAVLQDIPILEIDSEKGLYKRMKKMCEIGILEYLPIRTAGGCFSYYLITEMMADLVSSHSPQSYPEKPESYPQSPQSSYAIINSSTINSSTINSKEKTNKKEIPTISSLENVEPVVKENLITESNVESVYRKFLENEKARTDTIQFKRVAPKIKEALKECESVDILCDRIKTYLKYCNEAKSWYSKKDIQAWFNAGFYSLEKEKYYKDGIAKEQAKQQNLSGQKLIQKPVYEVSEEDKKKQEQELKEYENVKTEKFEFMEHFKSVLKNYFGSSHFSWIQSLKIKSTNENEVVFMLQCQIYVDVITRNKEKFEQVFNREFQGFGEEFTGKIKFVAWKI